jgi:hypothetical protein
MHAPKRDQSAFDGLPPVLDARRGAQALRCDGADGCERILDAMMQFVENELLQFVRSLAFLGVDSGCASKALASIAACASNRRRLPFSPSKTLAWSNWEKCLRLCS